jgi:hypothetical protein
VGFVIGIWEVEGFWLLIKTILMLFRKFCKEIIIVYDFGRLGVDDFV